MKIDWELTEKSAEIIHHDNVKPTIITIFFSWNYWRNFQIYIHFIFWNIHSIFWKKAVSSHSSHHPQNVLLAQFSLYVHKGVLKPDSSHRLEANPNLTISNRYNYFVLITSQLSLRNRIYPNFGLPEAYRIRRNLSQKTPLWYVMAMWSRN